MSSPAPALPYAVIMAAEDRAIYDLIGAQLVAAWKPINDDAHRLVKLLQDTQWRIDRLTLIDFNMLTLGTAEQIEAIDANYEPSVRQALAQAAAYRANARVFDQLQRHEVRLRRLFDQTRAELTLLSPATPQPAQQTAGFVPAVGFVPDTGFVPDIPATLSQPAPKLPKMPKFSGPMKDVHRKQWLRKHRPAA